MKGICEDAQTSLLLFLLLFLHSELDINAASTTPIGRLSLQECSDRSEVTFMSKKVSLFQPLTPELDGE